jgi:hypothetical protein
MVAVVVVDDALAQIGTDPANPAAVRGGPHGGQGQRPALRRTYGLVVVPLAPRARSLSSRQRSCSAATTTLISSGLA